jgi:branched-chain amino acid aminotransferase
MFYDMPIKRFRYFWVGKLLKHSANSKVNVNGVVTTPEKAKISVFDRGFLFGDSVYEVTRTYNGKPFLLEDHFERLWRSATSLDIEINLTKKELENEILKTLKEFHSGEAYIRIIITRGEGKIGLDPANVSKNNFVVIVKEQPENPTWWYEDGVHLAITDVIRNARNAMDPSIKSGNYLNNVMALIQGLKKDHNNQNNDEKLKVFDAIMLNQAGFVTESTVSNLWIISNGVIITPPVNAGILEGITRKTVIQMAKDYKMPLEIKEFKTEEMLASDECFLTSSTREIVPITRIDNKLISDGKPGLITKKIMDYYKDITNS